MSKKLTRSKLGYSEAAHLSQYGQKINSLAIEPCLPLNSLLGRMVEQHKIMLNSSPQTYKRKQNNCWSETITLDTDTGISQDYHVQFCFTASIFRLDLLVCLHPIDPVKIDQAFKNDLLKHNPYLLHLNHLGSQKIFELYRLTQLAGDNQNTWDCPLSRRELEVLRWTADGKTADEIGEILGVTPRTVNFHIAQMMSVLGVPNKTAIVSKAMLMGWMFD